MQIQNNAFIKHRMIHLGYIYIYIERERERERERELLGKYII